MCRPPALSAWADELQSAFPALTRQQVKVLAQYRAAGFGRGRLAQPGFGNGEFETALPSHPRQLRQVGRPLRNALAVTHDRPVSANSQ